jgi:hypothetical protein
MSIAVRSALNTYLNNNTQNIRAEFANVVERNDDGTYVCEPLSGDALIYNVRTYESALGFIKPLIGSVVTLQFYDNQTCYITNIIDYDEFSLLTENQTTIASNNDLTLIGKNVDIVVLKDDFDIDKINEIKNTQSRIKGQFRIDAAEDILMGSKYTGIIAEDQILMDSDNFDLLCKDFSVEADISTIKSQNITLDGLVDVKTIQLNQLLKDISNALTLIDTTLQAIAPNPALNGIVQLIKLKTDQL